MIELQTVAAAEATAAVCAVQQQLTGVSQRTQQQTEPDLEELSWQRAGSEVPQGCPQAFGFCPLAERQRKGCQKAVSPC